MQVLVQSLLGGVVIGAAASGLLLVNGRIAGVAGILAEATSFRPGLWRWGFLAGLIGTGVAANRIGLAAPAGLEVQGLWALAAAGLLVGFGARLGAGCTSGHGVCGLANLSLRSLVATLMFMASAGAVVFATHHLEPVRQILAQARLP